MMNNMFYAYGKFFNDEKEYSKHCKEWPDFPFDLDEFKRQMQMRVEEAELNHRMRQGNWTNREAYQILRMSTDWVKIENCD